MCKNLEYTQCKVRKIERKCHIKNKHILPLGREIVFTKTKLVLFYKNENYLSARVACQNSCIFSPIMSTTVKGSLYPDLDSRYYRILFYSCLLLYNLNDVFFFFFFFFFFLLLLFSRVSIK